MSRSLPAATDSSGTGHGVAVSVGTDAGEDGAEAPEDGCVLGVPEPPAEAEADADGPAGGRVALELGVAEGFADDSVPEPRRVVGGVEGVRVGDGERVTCGSGRIVVRCGATRTGEDAGRSSGRTNR
jgi:hypothetical protein